MVTKCDAVFYSAVFPEFASARLQHGRRDERWRSGFLVGVQRLRERDDGDVGALLGPIDSPGGKAKRGVGVGVDGVGREKEVFAQPQRGGHHDDHRQRTLEWDRAARIGNVGITGQRFG